MGTPIPPNLKWAQNKAQLFIRVLITDAKDKKVDFEEQRIIFSAMSSKQLYSFEVNLHSKIEPQSCSMKVTGRQIEIECKKALLEPYWPRLQQEKRAPRWIQQDWEKFVDEDQEIEDEQNKKEIQKKQKEEEKMKEIYLDQTGNIRPEDMLALQQRQEDMEKASLGTTKGMLELD